ncbi:early growth response protein 3-like isoform X2 [Brienomyrus brachyistius]|uniref:early growth response protein 3-like isoform X2 n=1 Tax=Brienomyrus brachyistius TaxID=42636 RepID=UPI0020B2C6B4|nr:early growth response protein 3-like isoform X2 [Brienomyrus brachyistius]
MTGNRTDRLPLALNTLINPIPDRLYSEDNVPSSTNIFTDTETDSLQSYAQMNIAESIMDLEMAGDKGTAELQYSPGVQLGRDGTTVTYTGRFTFDSPPAGGSGWCSDGSGGSSIISLVTAGVLGAVPPSGVEHDEPPSELEQEYGTPLPVYCGEAYQDPAGFPQSPTDGGTTISYSGVDYDTIKPPVDGGLFSTLPDYGLLQADIGVLEHKPFRTSDLAPAAPLDSLRVLKEKRGGVGGPRLQLALRPVRLRRYQSRPGRIPPHERPHGCPAEGCDRRFSRSDELSRHLRVHTGQRPFQCRVCLRRFGRSDHLTTHVRTHTGERPFACDLCPRRFARSDERRRHVRVHLKQRDKKLADEATGPGVGDSGGPCQVGGVTLLTGIVAGVCSTDVSAKADGGGGITAATIATDTGT